MKILEIIYEFPPIGGGGGMVTADVVKVLAEKGHTIDVITMRCADLPKIEHPHPNLTIHRVLSLRQNPNNCSYFSAIIFLLSGYVKGYKLLRQHSYDHIHGTFIFPSGVIAAPLARTFGVPLTLTAHGSDVPGHNSELQAVFKPLLGIWRWIVRQADSITAVSEYLRQTILAHIDSNVTIIPNGLDVSAFPPTNYSKNVIVVGRLQHFKGVQDTLHAWHNLSNKHGYNLIVAGDGPYLQELKSLAKKRGITVDFRGRLTRSDLRKLYKTASILVSASHLESFGGVIMEAMASGLAVIATNVGGCREVLGGSGTLVPTQDIAAITYGLQTYLDDPNLIRKHGNEARLRVERKYDIHVVAREYENVFLKPIRINDN